MKRPKWHNSMSLSTKPGAVVEFLSRNGWPGEVEHCRKLGMRRGRTYTVVRLEVYDSSSNVELAEFPGKRFNTVCFTNTRKRRAQQRSTEP
jgi:hypothetical protein